METFSASEALLTKKFYPVIHCIDPFRQQGSIGHTLRNILVAIENCADGVFLIGHDMQFSQLTHVYDQARKEFPNTWIGINFLDLGVRENWVGLETVTKGCVDLNALWIDTMPTYRLNLPKKTQVFGGVAFKYIDPNLSGEALTESCRKATERVDVATTSGERTGSPPNIQKLVSIRMALRGKVPLALASGVTEENIASLFPYVDTFLVASSICEKRRVGARMFDSLIPEKVRVLADAIHKQTE